MKNCLILQFCKPQQLLHSKAIKIPGCNSHQYFTQKKLALVNTIIY